MKNQQGREEGIEVDIEGVAPFHVLVVGGGSFQVSIGEEPKPGSNNGTDKDTVNKDYPQKELDEAQKV